MLITLEENIKLSALLYPSLFMDPFMDPELWPMSRQLVLCHMFLTLGNGYDWNAEGCLEESDYDGIFKKALPAVRSGDEKELLKIRRAVAKDYCRNSRLDKKLNKQRLFDFNAWNREYRELRRKNLIWEGKDAEESYFHPYPINSPKGHRIGTLAEIPDNIQPDYLAGALEILNAVVTLPFTGNDVADQKTFAAEWIAELKERFACPTLKT